MLSRETRRSLILKATAQAEKVRVKCGLKPSAIVDPVNIAEQRGCEVRFLSLPSLDGVYSPEPRPTIILGSERPAGRRAYTCAHELGHHEFNHGTRLEEVKDGISSDNEDEFLADMFAAILLMPKNGVIRNLKLRNIDPHNIDPIQLFKLASFFGVGYATLIGHMTWTLNLLNSRQREELLKTQPKTFKISFGGDPKSELVIAGEEWVGRVIDLEVGGLLVLPSEATVEGCGHFEHHGVVDGQAVYKAARRGYSRAYSDSSDWAANIRIAPKYYVGLARYRFLEDSAEDEV